jgi:pyruvate kinase
MVRGVVPKHVGSMIGTDSVLMRASEMGKEMGWVKEGDAVATLSLRRG